MGGEYGREEGRETVGQVAQTRDRQQCAQDTREEVELKKR